MATIFAVETKAGLVTRSSVTKQYTHAVVVNEWPESWASTYEYAKKAAARYKGATIKPVRVLEKQPRDPNPNRHVFGITLDRAINGVSYGYLVTDDASDKAYIKAWKDWGDANGKGYVKGKEIVGYLDKLRILYQLDSWLEGGK